MHSEVSSKLERGAEGDLIKIGEALFFHPLFYPPSINKLESRPSARSITLSKPWEYVLYVDFDGSLADANVKNALTNLQGEC